MDLRGGLQLDDPPVYVAWRTPLPALPSLLVERREPTRAHPLVGGEWVAPIRVFGERWHLVLGFDSNAEVSKLVLQPPRDEQPEIWGEPPSHAEQLAAHEARILRRRAALVDALGPAEIEPGSRTEPCASARWVTEGARIDHEVVWITERGYDGWLQDEVRVSPL